ncbi:MAG: hypothetical protein U1F51_08790 [Burkholderiales bacterium]
MKIDTAAVSMSSAHAESSRRSVRETLRAWVGPRPSDAASAGAVPRPAAASAVVALSDAARASVVADAPAHGSAEAAAIEDAAKAARDSPQMRLIRAIVEFLTGREVDTVDLTALGADIRAVEADTAALAAVTPSDPGWGVEFDRREVVDEAETTTYSASGVVRTADGREIAFSASLAMARSRHEETSTSIRAGNARPKDPLVIDLDGRAAELASTRFRFDLDSDGRAEDVPLLSGGGYLALDLDGDGRITSGAELFGPREGDGFAELSRHDTDANGWIDEGDATYRRLRVWTPDADGGGTLVPLAEQGIGAIHLGRIATPFDLRSTANESLGAVRTTGVWVGEDGAAGTLRQIDLAV